MIRQAWADRQFPYGYCHLWLLQDQHVSLRVESHGLILQSSTPRSPLHLHHNLVPDHLACLGPQARAMLPLGTATYSWNDWVSDGAACLAAFRLTVSYIIAVTTLKTGPRYFSLFLMLGGLFGSYNVALAVSDS